MLDDKERRRAKALCLKKMDEVDAAIRDWMKSHDMDDIERVQASVTRLQDLLPEVDDTDESPMHMMATFAMYGMMRAMTSYGMRGLESME